MKKKKSIALMICTSLMFIFSVSASAQSQTGATEFFESLVRFPLALVLFIVCCVGVIVPIVLRRVLNKKIGQTKADIMLKVFIIVFAVFGVACLVLGLVTRGESWSYMMHVSGSGLPATQFENYFNNVKVAQLGRFNELNSKYSPMSIFIMFLIGKFFPNRFLASFSGTEYVAVLQNTTTMLPLVILIVACFIICYYSFQKVLRRNGHNVKNELVLFLLVFAFPVTYAVELSDVTSLSFVMVSFFFLFKDSKSSNLREVSTIVLSLAGSINLPVFVLTLLFIVNKKYARFFRSLFYGLVFFLVPAVLTGFKGAFRYIESIFSVSELHFIPGNGSIVNLLRLFGVKGKILPIIIFVVTDVIALAAMMMLKKEYQRMSAFAYIVANIMFWKDSSCMLFMIIPLISLLSERTHEARSWSYLADLSCIILPIPTWFYFNLDEMSALQDSVPSIYRFTFSANQLIIPFAVQGLLLMLTVDLIRETVSMIKNNPKKEKTKPIEPEITENETSEEKITEAV